MNNKFEIKYKSLLNKCLSNGVVDTNRTGINTYKLYNEILNINLNEGFPIVTGKKIFYKKGLAEFKWIYKGKTDLKYLNKRNVFWWNDFVLENNTLGKVYGYQIRNFNNIFDQVKYCINEIKNNSRRAIITLWNPCDLKEQAIPCCYTHFNFVRFKNKLNMIMHFRSSDLFLGLPYDIIVGALFLNKISKKTNLIANELSINLADAHIYETHLKQVNTYLNNKIYDLPVIKKNKLINYKHNEYIKADIVI